MNCREVAAECAVCAARKADGGVALRYEQAQIPRSGGNWTRMIFLQTNWILAFVCAFVFFGAGKQNTGIPGGKNQSFLWAGLSIAVSALAIQLFGAGWILILVAQIGLFVAIAIFRSFRDR